MLRIAVFDFQITFGNCGGGNEGSRFNSIRNDRVLCATQGFDAVNLNGWRTGPTYARSHLVEQLREVAHFGFACSILNGGAAVSEGRCHHQILGPGYGDLIETNFGADQSISGRARDHVAGFQENVRAHFRESRKV